MADKADERVKLLSYLNIQGIAREQASLEAESAPPFAAKAMLNYIELKRERWAVTGVRMTRRV